jgi:hypothetical protein
MSIKSTVLDTSPTTIYSSGGSSAVTIIHFCNTAPGPATFNVYLVPTGGIADNTNIIYYSVQITASDTFVLDTERFLFDDGDQIVASANLPGVVATVNYVSL